MKEKVVLVERNYKGFYERFALTQEEFYRTYPDAATDENEGDFTDKPLVHIWFKKTEIKSPEWIRFFSDMTYELPASDVDSGNIASIRYDLFQSLSLE